VVLSWLILTDSVVYCTLRGWQTASCGV